MALVRESGEVRADRLGMIPAGGPHGGPYHYADYLGSKQRASALANAGAQAPRLVPAAVSIPFFRIPGRTGNILLATLPAAAREYSLRFPDHNRKAAMRAVRIERPHSPSPNRRKNRTLRFPIPPPDVVRWTPVIPADGART